ncbi:hypothetical protein Kfla_4267 [Kribbella flavida DSM 17836]|uniref:Uncharacterized protein n=1 Tax=Kribbella flavida (strain DSM 17836 / JCM 10339 / NBRC 14399) TaxID=479435 RepID=D2PU19_KRIFD|nr:hypothetical protein [Kribbella flavida]ADB33302.1 hypothetical protein Kfla_4267 [Kribbella flavida DSM 17836]
MEPMSLLVARNITVDQMRESFESEAAAPTMRRGPAALVAWCRAWSTRLVRGRGFRRGFGRELGREPGTCSGTN